MHFLYVVVSAVPAQRKLDPNAASNVVCDKSVNLKQFDINRALLSICGGIQGQIQKCQGAPTSTTGVFGGAKFTAQPVNQGATINVSKGRWEAGIFAAQAICGTNGFSAIFPLGTSNGNLKVTMGSSGQASVAPAGKPVAPKAVQKTPAPQAAPALASFAQIDISKLTGNGQEASQAAQNMCPASLGRDELQHRHDIAEDAELEIFNPAIAKATGAEKDTLQCQKLRNKILKLTCEVGAAKAKGNTAKAEEEAVKLNKNIGLVNECGGK
ncbi:hypothetical protein EDD86DRAFT_53746 [Gorgonomyces haynaldii]|nr:hypothetical protein EDD86DRAFT_53746 [Gorgonomyces haynaldii]